MPHAHLRASGCPGRRSRRALHRRDPRRVDGRGGAVSDTHDYSKGFGARAAVSLGRPGLHDLVSEAVDRQSAARLQALESLDDPEALRDLAAEIRDDALARLDERLASLAANWEAAGGTVFFAADADEARSYVADLATRTGAKTAVKSKSMVTEEIGLNAVLEQMGVEAIETDLGEFINQVAGDHPSHIVAPAIHHSKADVARLFSRLSDEPRDEDAQALTGFARAYLREKFLSAELGITGANFGISEAGALCIVSNEGNARMCMSLPPVHVAVMGMERVIGTWDELAVMLALLCRSATGQKITQYVSLLNGARRSDEPDGPEESHLVIVDNGRSNLLGTRYSSALRCIRCGACLNVCPVFRQTGGHAYDPVYSGPIGAVINPLMKGTDEAGELAHASTLCGACTAVCPVRIPLHDLLVYLRQEYARESAPATERAGYQVWARAWSNGRRFAWFSRVGNRFGRIMGDRVGTRLPLPLLSRWTRPGRRLPSFPDKAYRDERKGAGG
ncbi:MAG: iron-sulfur cluster-binding protein [Actinobacteria bacterium]|nr:iron-sulfur cluster-binding protein [Actinomycetota bacterium]